MKKYTNTELWDISAQALHSDGYRTIYMSILQDQIPNKKAKILDTACGTGFPTDDLLRTGYTNITCVDGDKESTQTIQSRLKDFGANIPVIHSRWQELEKHVQGVFDVLLNVDNSFVYFDSWNLSKNTEISKEAIFKRARNVLQQFYNKLSPNGLLIIAIAKNNKENIESKEVPIGTVTRDGEFFDVVWKLSYDWKKRKKSWENKIMTDDGVSSVEMESYLITENELRSFLSDVGFKNIKTIRKDGLYDDVIVAQK